MSIAASRRRSNCNEYRVSLGYRAAELRGKEQPPLLDVRANNIPKPWFEDRNLTRVQRRDLRAILVDAGDLVAEIGDTGPRNKSYIASADHRNPHAQRSLSRSQFNPVTKSLAPRSRRIKSKYCAQRSMSHSVRPTSAVDCSFSRMPFKSKQIFAVLTVTIACATPLFPTHGTPLPLPHAANAAFVACFEDEQPRAPAHCADSAVLSDTRFALAAADIGTWRLIRTPDP